MMPWRSLSHRRRDRRGAGGAIPAFAQAPPPASSGPMTVERLHSGFFGGADVKVTDFNHNTSELIGGQGGWVIDDALFIGGAGYGMVNGGRDDELWYGGPSCSGWCR